MDDVRAHASADEEPGAEAQADVMSRLLGHIDGYQPSALIYAATRLGLADALAAGPRDVAMLSASLGVAMQPLQRLMRALGSLDVCHEVETDRYALGAAGQFLREDHPQTLRHKSLLSVEQYWQSWAALAYSVRTGLPAFEHVHGLTPWAYRQRHPAQGTSFSTWMRQETARVATTLASEIDLGGAAVVADIGGGEGALLASVLASHPAIRGVLFDQPAVVEAAEAEFRRVGLATRCRCVAGDMFERVPVAADVFLLKSVLHDWDDERSAAVLAHCRAAMHRDSRLLVIERLLPEPGQPPDHRVTSLDIAMLLVTGGRERRLSEYVALLERTGLSLRSVSPSASGFSVMEAVAAA